MSCYECPVFLAVSRKLTKKFPSVAWRGKGLPVIVQRETVVFGDRFNAIPYQDRHIKLPKAVQEKIRVFDLGQTVRPFEFYLVLPKAVVQEIRRCSSTLPSEKKTSKTGSAHLPVTTPSIEHYGVRGTTFLLPKKSYRTKHSA